MPTTRAQTPRIMLVDGHSVAFRAYYAIPDTVRDARDRPANAVYGFMNTLYRTLQDHGPTHAAVTFDLGAPFREAMFSGYKASRDMGPEDLEPQVELVVEDDGMGLGESRPGHTGMGLHIMDYRARSMGGVFACGKSDQGGVRVSCCVPHPQREKIAQ